MPFYAHPTAPISPGDIFPSIPISISVPPIKVARKSKYSPPARVGPQDLRRIYALPADADKVPDLHLEAKGGEETLATTRIGLAMFLSWGSQVEADERDLAETGKAKMKGWLAAPIYSLQNIPENASIEDPDTHVQISMRHVVRENLSNNYFYLPPFPGASDSREYYVDFRKISAVGIRFFIDNKGARIATLAEESLNLLFSRLMWFFTRAEYFFQTIQCGGCGKPVPVDIRFEGQNFDAEPWG
jgi:hypothetical protein